MSGTGQGQRSAEERRGEQSGTEKRDERRVERDTRRVVLGPKRRVALGEECACMIRAVGVR